MLKRLTSEMMNLSKVKLLKKLTSLNIQSSTSSKYVHTGVKVSTEVIQTVIPVASKRNDSHVSKFNMFLEANPHISSLRSKIPQKYMELHRKAESTFAYLIAPDVAQNVVRNHMLPTLQANTGQLIFISKPGLGLIAEELIAAGIRSFCLCENCTLFQDHLKTVFREYENSVKLFTNDILTYFKTSRRRADGQHEIEGSLLELLKGITKKNWEDSPVMAIIGSASDKSFIIHLIKSLVMQEFVVSFGRLQMFLFMRPADFIGLTAGPHSNLKVYTKWSVFFNLFFDFELLDKFPKEVLIPWQAKRNYKNLLYHENIDSHLTYFVKIGFKKNLPVNHQQLLAFYVFIRHFMKKRGAEVIPTLEKWKPGLGHNILFPTAYVGDYFPNINLFTKFGELTPNEMLAIFKEVVAHTDIDGHHLLMLGSDFDKACNEYFIDISSRKSERLTNCDQADTDIQNL